MVPIVKVSYFAHGTTECGARIASGNVDGDCCDEILTAPGPGPSFGPEVRGFDYDGSRIGAVPGLDFFAFSHGGYGASVGPGDVDGDGVDEFVCSPGAGPSLQARFVGYGYGGSRVRWLKGYDGTPFPTRYGGRPAAGRIDGRDRDALLACAGPDPAAPSTVLTFRYSGASLDPLPVTHAPFATAYGVNAGAGSLGC